MAINYYIARAKDDRTLELPEEARDLGLKPGDEVNVAVDQRPNGWNSYVSSAEEALAIIDQIREQHVGCRVTDNLSTQRLLDEARDGAAYGYEPTN